MNFTHLRYFYEVCRFQNITKAAEYLHVSQPSVSLAMKNLEATTGLNLLHRNGKHILITNDGQHLYRNVLPIIKSMDKLETTIKDLAQTKNNIRLAVPLQIGTILLPAIIGEFKKLHPEINLDVLETGGIDTLKALEHNEFDLAVANFDKNSSDDLIYNKIYDVECCFMTYPSHPLAKRKTVSIEDIIEEPLVLLNTTFFVSNIINKAFSKISLQPNILLYTSSLHTAKNLVQQEVASTVLARQAILSNENIVAIPFKKPLYIHPGIVMKRGHQLYNDEKLLINFIKEKFRKK